VLPCSAAPAAVPAGAGVPALAPGGGRLGGRRGPAPQVECSIPCVPLEPVPISRPVPSMIVGPSACQLKTMWGPQHHPWRCSGLSAVGVFHFVDHFGLTGVSDPCSAGWLRRRASSCRLVGWSGRLPAAAQQMQVLTAFGLCDQHLPPLKMRMHVRLPSEAERLLLGCFPAAGCVAEMFHLL